MASVVRRKGFINWPEPLQGPDYIYKNDRKSNPALRGLVLVVAAWLMETFRFIRETIWRNAGFGDLRKIQLSIEDYEPLFDPTVIPLEDPLLSATDAEAEPPSELRRRAKFPDGARYYSAADYRALYLSGELTPLDVAKALLPLIRRDITPRGPHSVAWFDTKVDLVLKAAKASTQRYQEKRSLGPLDGVPTAVKDEYDMEGYMSCLGSVNDYTGTITEDNSTTAWCVRKLQDAGCVILGKLSMVEFGLDTPGNNPNYGTPPNPHNPNYYTGGSSSGTAYAVSAGLIPIGLGSDGGGSIRIPASFCGVYGIKPTHGRISFKPGQNHCITCACLGPIASDIQSLATLLEVIGAPHPSSHFPPIPPVSRMLAPTADDSKVLGIPEEWFAASEPAVQELCRSFIKTLVAQHGYRTVPIRIPFLVEGQMAHALTVLTDASTLLPDTRGLTAANRILLAIGRSSPATDFLLAQKLRRLLMQHLAWLWREHPGMLIVTPTTSCAGWPVRSPGELSRGVSDGDQTLKTMEYVWLANFCGLPSIAVPAGFVTPEGQPGAGSVAERTTRGRVPVGLMATGEWASEAQLLRFGLDAEEVVAVGARMDRPPIWVDAVALAKDEAERRRNSV